MKKLLVLANGFPYGTWETYMETEEGYYSAFDKVWIASLQLRGEQAVSKRPLKCQAAVIPVPYKAKLFYLLNSLAVLGDRELYGEIAALKRSGRLSLSRVVDLFVYLSRAHHEARVIDRALKGEDKGDILLYSYRLEYQPYVAILLKRKWRGQNRIVARAHGYDLYEERHPSDYIPLRGTVFAEVDRVFPCSEHGADYIRRRYGDVRARIECSYLGTVDHGERSCPSGMKPFRIVSCSNVIQVKRLEKIVNALSMIDDIDIEWTHYGDGPLLGDVKRLAAQKLGKNVKAVFPGNVDNTALLKAYASTDYHLLLNVSASEGLPVSIMEAMSFGIPCAATDVGGTGELVSNENGFLLDANVDDGAIADLVRRISAMDMGEYGALRARARAAWNEKFNSEANYSKFTDTLMDI